MREVGHIAAIGFIETDDGNLAFGAEGEGVPSIELTPAQCGVLVSASQLWREGKEEVPTTLVPGVYGGLGAVGPVLAMGIRGDVFSVSRDGVMIAAFTRAEAEGMETLIEAWWGELEPPVVPDREPGTDAATEALDLATALVGGPGDEHPGNRPRDERQIAIERGLGMEVIVLLDGMPVGNFARHELRKIGALARVFGDAMPGTAVVTGSFQGGVHVVADVKGFSVAVVGNLKFLLTHEEAGTFANIVIGILDSLTWEENA